MHIHKYLKIFSGTLILILGLSYSLAGFTNARPLELFPMQNYDQNIDHWLKPSDPNYKKPLIEYSEQRKRLQEYYDHYYSTEKGGYSPWNSAVIEKRIARENFYTIQKTLLKLFSNKGKKDQDIGYGSNFHPYKEDWIEKIGKNLNVEQFKSLKEFKSENRAILVQNTYARALPTQEPHFYHYEYPGNGYPFDNLQMSSLWIGTPIYILGQTADETWSLVITPDVIAWVQSEAIAKVDDGFIKHWQDTAKQNLVAVTKTEAAIKFAPPHKNLSYKTYVGTIFPMVSEETSYRKIFFPIKDEDNNAKIKQAYIHKEESAIMPLAATPENFAKLIKTLQGRPYGWGGIYFYNDCSQEMKSLYTPFGFWLPRHSSDQQKAGKTADKSHLAIDDRIKYLEKNAKPLMTLIHYNGHILMYMGHYQHPKYRDKIPMSYQSMWGLRPKDGSSRFVIGQTAIFPLLKCFPENMRLNSQMNNSTFHVVHLDKYQTAKT